MTSENRFPAQCSGWNYCFICSSLIISDAKQLITSPALSKPSEKLILILKYLLGGSDKERAFYEDVVQFNRKFSGDEEGRVVGVQFCGWCEDIGESIKELQLQLNVIEMKIVDKLKTVRQAVVANSRLYGCNTGVKEEIGRFEQWLEEQEGVGRDLKLEREFLEVLHQFQTFMFEKDEQLWNIPLVILEKAVGSEAISRSKRMPCSQVGEENESDVEDVVKEEPVEELEEFEEGEGEDHHFDFDLSYEEDQIEEQNEVDSDSDFVVEDDAAIPESDEETESTEDQEDSYNRIEDKASVQKRISYINRKRATAGIDTRKRKYMDGMDQDDTLNKDYKTGRNETDVVGNCVKEGATFRNRKRKAIMDYSGDPGVVESRKRRKEILTDENGSKGKSVNRKACKNYILNMSKLIMPELQKKKDLPWPAPSYKTEGQRMALEIVQERLSSRTVNRYKKNVCDKCSVQLINPANLETHLKKHETDEKPHECPDCAETFSQKQLLLVHLVRHCFSGEKSEKGNRKACKNYSLSMSKQIMPELRKNPKLPWPTPTYKTEGQQLALELVRQRMIESIYKQYNKTTCDECNYKPKNPSTIESHLETHETDEKPHECPDCELRFTQKQLFLIHLIRHCYSGDGKGNRKSCTNYLLQLSKLIMPELKKDSGSKYWPVPSYKTEGQRLALELVQQRLNGDNVNKYKKDICDRCSFQPKNPTNLESHLQQHETDDKPHGCPDCGERFTQQQLLLVHLVHHCFSGSKDAPAKITKRPANRCDLCDHTVLPTDMKEHLMTHHDGKVYQCQSCTKCFGYYPNLIFHFRKHLPNDSSVMENLTCELCPDNPDSKPFLRRTYLLKHLYHRHGFKELLITCDYPNCSSTFFDKATKKNHMKIHTDKYLCEVCKKPFMSCSSLKDHIRVAHTKDNKYKCDLCPESFLWPCKLASHKIATHNFPKYKCELCPKEFTHRSGLISHKRNYHSEEGPFKCDKCGKEFRSKHRLKMHLHMHSETNDFTCEICGFATRSSKLLQNHKKRHSEKKNYACSYCDKKFAMKQYLDSHLRTHTKEKPFQCEFCPASFAQKSGLNMHKRKQHQNLQQSGEDDGYLFGGATRGSGLDCSSAAATVSSMKSEEF